MSESDHPSSDKALEVTFQQTKPPLSTEAAERRRCAEERWQARQPEQEMDRSDADTHRLVHELQVHQIELELQNEALHRARNEVEAVLEKFSDLYDFAPVGYLTLDREGTILEANLAAVKLLGDERSRLVQRRLGLHIAETDRPVFNAFIEKVFTRKTNTFCEVSLLEEGRAAVEVRIEAMVAASGRECRAAVTDITDRKRAEMDRLILSKLESTGVLAGHMADDYSNLLTTILLNLELARTLAPPGEEFLARRLETAERAALLAQDLTRQLVTFTHGDPPVRMATSLAAILESSVRSALAGSPIRCEWALAGNLWSAEVDMGQISQAFRNLVLNAREAMATRGLISVEAENAVLGVGNPLSLPPGDYVRVSITDRGEGMAREVLLRVFDPYFSTKQRGQRKGLGLGLTISHAIFQQHGGGVSIESELGVGTNVHVYLPACRTP